MPHRSPTHADIGRTVHFGNLTGTLRTITHYDGQTVYRVERGGVMYTAYVVRVTPNPEPQP